jgi:transcriptional regulator with XRE-family HTH domain
MTEQQVSTPSRAAIRLGNEMRRRGLSDAACGELIGCTQSCVSRIRRGKRMPRPDLMGRICEQFQIPYGDWFSYPSPDQQEAA